MSHAERKKRQKDKENELFKEPFLTPDTCRSKMAEKIGPNKHKDDSNTFVGSTNSIFILKNSSISDEVLSKYFHSPMTSLLVPQDGSPLLKHKKYVQDTLIQSFSLNSFHVHTLRSSLLNLEVPANPTIIA